jgi:peptidoglycan hydrolase CwlO-like protein
MTRLIIILAHSVTGAVLSIAGLLLVAAIIGYLTAWFYAKSVYVPVIKGLEAEKADLQKQVAGLKDEVGTLGKKVDDLNERIGMIEAEAAKKDKEIADLKGKIRG